MKTCSSRASLVACAMFLALTVTGAVADENPDIRSLMTAQEYEAAGLDKLSEQEREALARWLQRYTAGDTAKVAPPPPAAARRAPTADTGQALPEPEPMWKQAEEKDIVSTIATPFEGWRGNTVFRLANGQVWQQRRRGNYFYDGPPNPEVRISRNFMGFHTMEVVETGKSVQVKRIR